MDFCTHPLSREKTLEDLKEIADLIKEEISQN